MVPIFVNYSIPELWCGFYLDKRYKLKTICRLLEVFDSVADEHDNDHAAVAHLPELPLVDLVRYQRFRLQDHLRHSSEDLY